MVTPSEMRLVKQNPNQQVVDWWIALLTHMEMGTFRQIQVVGIRCKKNFQTAIFCIIAQIEPDMYAAGPLWLPRNR